MKALRLHAHGEPCLHNEPEPVFLTGEGMSRVVGVGVSKSDLDWLGEGEIRNASSPRDKFEITISGHGR